MMRRGRPTIPISPHGGTLSAWCDADTIEGVDDLRDGTNTSRADVVRAAVRFALEHDEFFVYFLERTPS